MPMNFERQLQKSLEPVMSALRFINENQTKLIRAEDDLKRSLTSELQFIRQALENLENEITAQTNELNEVKDEIEEFKKD